MVACVLVLPLLAACAPDAATKDAVPTPKAVAPFSGTDTNLLPAQLETLASRVALYPDDLLALVLAAATQPLQVGDAQRLLKEREADSSKRPPNTWDPSVVALLNYPEALSLMSADPAWLGQLGTSVAYQQAGVMDAVQSIRRKALQAGILKSDDKQNVLVQYAASGEPDVIVIDSVDPDVIHVPVYEPAAAVYPGSPYPSYWSASYPYYYDPAAPFFMGAFFGTAIGYGCSWDDHDIYRGDVTIDRARIRERIENRRSSALADQIRHNPENVWRADRSGLEGARAAAADRHAALQPPAPAGRNLGSGVGNRALSSGAFSGIDRGAAANRFSARGFGSLGGGFRAGAGGFRGGGGRR